MTSDTTRKIAHIQCTGYAPVQMPHAPNCAANLNAYPSAALRESPILNDYLSLLSEVSDAIDAHIAADLDAFGIRLLRALTHG